MSIDLSRIQPIIRDNTEYRERSSDIGTFIFLLDIRVSIPKFLGILDCHFYGSENTLTETSVSSSWRFGRAVATSMRNGASRRVITAGVAAL